MLENTEKKIGLYTPSRSGHRGAYADFAKDILNGELMGLKKIAFKKKPILFLMADHHFHIYFLVSTLRAAFGKRTVGLLFRPEPVVKGKSKSQKIKKKLLFFMKSIKNIRTISIVPTPLRPEISSVVDGWIYDFQLWDLDDGAKKLFTGLKQKNLSEDRIATEFYTKIKKQAQGRPIIVSLGVQNKSKGYELLAEALPSLSNDGWFVVVAGKVAECNEEQRKIFDEYSALSENRFLEDEEVIAAYAAADVVWCLYDQSYDQASGILGRAIQLNVPPIVRKGSISEKLCNIEDIACFSADQASNVSKSLQNYKVLSSAETTPKSVNKFRLTSIEKLRESFN